MFVVAKKFLSRPKHFDRLKTEPALKPGSTRKVPPDVQPCEDITGFFRKASQSLVRPWALILGGRLYGANVWVEYYRYLYLSPYTVRPTLYRSEFEYYLQLSPYPSGRQTFFIAAQITFSIAIEDPLYLKPLEQNVCMCSCSDRGNMQLPYNSPSGYLVHVLFSQCVYFPINGPGRPSGKLLFSKLVKEKSR